MIKNIYLIAITILLLPLPTYATSFGLIEVGGVGFSSIASNVEVQINDIVTNQYDIDSQHQAKAVVGSGIGITSPGFSQNRLVAGLNVMFYHTNFGGMEGLEHPFSNMGEFDTLNFKFNARSNALLIEPMLVYQKYSWQPYIIAGLGVAWNQLYDYSEYPTDPNSSAAVVPAPFSDMSNNSFAYEIGVGIQKIVFMDTKKRCSLALAFDYRYLNFGKAKLGLIPDQVQPEHFEISNLNNQTLLLSLKAFVL